MIVFYDGNVLNPLSWLLSQITIVETIDGGEIGLNPVAMTFINPQKVYLDKLGIEPVTSWSQVLTVPYRVSYGARLVWKWENAGYRHFLIFQKSFLSIQGQILLLNPFRNVKF